MVNSHEMEMIVFSKEQAEETMKKLMAEFDAKSKILVKSGFIFGLSHRFKGNRIVHLPGTPYHGMHHLTAENLIQEGFRKKTILTAQQKKDAVDVLRIEYKIHLMPKPEYLLSVVKRFLAACNEHPELLNHIHQFKIYTHPMSEEQVPKGIIQRSVQDAIVPHMVIYLHIGKDLKESQASANFVLEKLYQVFADYNTNQIGLMIAPRKTEAANLMGYTNGGGNVKLDLTGSQQEELLSNSQVVYDYSEKDPKSSEKHLQKSSHQSSQKSEPSSSLDSVHHIDYHLHNPAFADLRLLAALLRKMRTLLPFSCKGFEICRGNTQCIMPHVRFYMKIPENRLPTTHPKNIGLISDQHFEQLVLFSMALKQVGMVNRVLEPKEVVQKSEGNYLRALIAVCLPGDLTVIRNKSEEVFNFIQANFKKYESRWNEGQELNIDTKTTLESKGKQEIKPNKADQKGQKRKIQTVENSEDSNDSSSKDSSNQEKAEITKAEKMSKGELGEPAKMELNKEDDVLQETTNASKRRKL